LTYIPQGTYLANVLLRYEVMEAGIAILSSNLAACSNAM